MEKKIHHNNKAKKLTIDKSKNTNTSMNQSFDFKGLGKALLNNVGLLGGIISLISTISSWAYEVKFYKIMPEEYEKEVEQAEKRKKMGDIFHPNYDEYLKMLKKAKDDNVMFIIKWERHFTKSEWTARIPKDEKELDSYFKYQ